MTRLKIHALRWPVMPAVAIIGALALAGCSSGNIGESWQCPLAEGGTCNSVVAADPAVPDAGTAGRTVLNEPLWQVRADRPPEKPEAPTCEAACGGFDPVGWLMWLFGGDEGNDKGATEGAGPEITANIPPAAVAEASAPNAAASHPLAVETTSRALQPDPAALPAEPETAEDDPDGDSRRSDDLRTGEVVARIWIAPFVDADGVYREASHVRVVLEPAGWRLPR